MVERVAGGHDARRDRHRIPSEKQIALFLADPGGGVYTCLGDPQRGFGPWSSVSQGARRQAERSPPYHGEIKSHCFSPIRRAGFTRFGEHLGTGGIGLVSPKGAQCQAQPIGAIPWNNNQIALFLADRGAGVYTCLGDPQHGFGGWSSVSAGGHDAGGTVTALPWEKQVALFLADPKGGVFSLWGTPGRWGDWATVSQGGTTPGANHSSVGRPPDRPVSRRPRRRNLRGARGPRKWIRALERRVAGEVYAWRACQCSLERTQHGADPCRSQWRGVLNPVGSATDPDKVRITSVTSSEINLAWVDNVDDEDGFRVSYSGQGSGSGQVDNGKTISLPADARSASLKNLFDGYFYNINVAAFNLAGESPSVLVTGTAINTGPPTGPFITAGVEDFDIQNGWYLLHVTGTGFQPNETVNLNITVKDLNGLPAQAAVSTQADSSGNVDYNYTGGSVSVCNPDLSGAEPSR